MECLNCSKLLQSTDVSVTCCDCKRRAHISCTKLNQDQVRLLIEKGTNWRCRPCTKARAGKEKSHNEAKDTKLHPPTPYEKGMGDLNSKAKKESYSELVDLVEQTRDEMKTSLAGINKGITENHSNISSTAEELKAAQEMIERLIEQNEELSRSVEDLIRRADSTEQSIKRNGLEIIGIPDQPGENLLELFKLICSLVGFKIQDTMIDTCYRVTLETKPGCHGLLVFFVRRIDRDLFLKKYRECKGLNTTDLGFKVSSVIHIQECLSSAKRLLLIEAAKLTKSYNFLGVGILNGEIFLKKTEDASPIHIRNQSDLENLQKTK